jgi:transposase
MKPIVPRELDKETLERLYIQEKMSLRSIANLYGRSYLFVHYRKQKYGIPTRPFPKRKEISQETLFKLIVKEGKSLEKAAKQLSCSPITVRKRCDEYGIKTKSECLPKIPKAKLQKLFVKEGKSTREVAKELGCSYEIIRKKFKHYGIPKRNAGTKKIKIDETTLWKLYVQQGKSFSEIAKVFDCSVGPICRKIKHMELVKE